MNNEKKTFFSDWVQLGVGGAEFLLGAIVAWWGRGMRHFALSGWLGATAVSGLIVLAFPFAQSGAPSVGKSYINSQCKELA